MKFLIIEDEIINYNYLKSILLELYPSCDIQGPLSTIDEIYKNLKSNIYDIIFADVEISDGISMTAIEKADVSTPVIYITAYGKYALESYKVKGVDFIMKPYFIDDVKNSLNKVLSLAESLSKIKLDGKKSLFKFYNKSGFSLIKPQEISHLTSKVNNTTAYLMNGSEGLLLQSISELETMLNHDDFFRVSRSTIINIESIKEVFSDKRNSLSLTLKNYPTIISISKANIPLFKVWLDR